MISFFNELLQSKIFPSHYLITKYRSNLDNGIIDFLLKYTHLIPEDYNKSRIRYQTDNEDNYLGKKLNV